ncbi:MAG: hypothetical protein WC799_15605 [Desulfobacteraceae bacterium]|jgi:non-specific protein-tyrosine kinase
MDKGINLMQGKTKYDMVPVSEGSGRSSLRLSNVWKAPVYSKSRLLRPEKNVMIEKRCIFGDSPALNHFKVFRTQFRQRTREYGWNSIMVTSPGKGEGKTQIAVNLGLSFARDFHETVMIVDCDLKKQDVSRSFGIDSQYGIIDVVLNQKPLNEVIFWPYIDKLTIISGGRPISDGAEVLGSPGMTMLCRDLKTRYADRYVLYDMPPVLDRAEAIVFAPLVDGILLVIEEGGTSMRDIQRALEILPKEKMLGFVMNRKIL